MILYDLLGGIVAKPTEEDGVSWVGFISPYYLAQHEGPHWGWPKYEHWLAHHHTLVVPAEPFRLAMPKARCCPS